MASEKRKTRYSRGGRTSQRPPAPQELPRTGAGRRSEDALSNSDAAVRQTPKRAPVKQKTGGKKKKQPPVAAGMDKPADAGQLRRQAAARARKARAQQAAQERARRARRRARRREAKEVEPFRFREVRHRPVLYRRSDGKTAELLYKTALGIAITAIVLFVLFAFFEVRTIRCNSTQRYSGEEIIHYSGIETGDKMLFLSRGKAADRILDALPYIESVSIRQKYPTTVDIEVTERIPTAKIVDGGISYIIDDQGYLLEYTVAGALYDLPEIVCTAPVELETGKQLVFSDPLMLETLQNVLAYIVGSDWIQNIDSINLERIYSISFLYQNRITVQLGDTSDLEMKLALLAEVIERNSEEAAGTIDVSNIERVSFQPLR